MNRKKKRILVTGADGFIGSHLVERLVELGYSVRAFVYYNSFNSYGWLDTLPKTKLAAIDVFSGDVRDPNGVKNAVSGCDVVMHLAALIGIPFSYHSPDSYVDTNVKGTLNILNACRGGAVQKVLVTSTSEVYGTARYVPIDEQHPYQGQSPYSATKIAADQLALSFYRSFDLPVTVVRPFNTYGPRQSARAIIPTIITQMMAQSNEVRLGSLHPTRDLVYVKDTVDGFIAIMNSEKTIGKEINIATQTEISMGDLAGKIKKIIGADVSIKTDSVRKRPRKSEVERLVGKNTLIRRLTAWKPSYSLEKGLAETIEWFKDESNLQRYKADIYNV